MAAPWKALQLPQLPAGVQTAVNQLGSISSSLADALRILQTALDTLANLEVLNLSVTQLAVQASLTAISSAITSLTQDTGLYVLYVPVQRKIVVSPIIRDALNATGLTDLPTGTVTSPLLANVTVAAQANGYDPKLAEFYSSLSNAQGGNAGFVRAVADSLVDEGDANRPMLDTAPYVAGVYMLAGGPDFLSVLSFITSVTALIAPRQPATALDVPGEPVPTGVSARSVPDAVLVEWDFQEPLVDIPTLNLTALVTQVAILRSTDPAFLTKTTVQEIFGTGTLSKGQRSGETEVVDVLDYSGIDLKSTYLDATASKGKVYYYAVAFNYKGGASTDILAGKGKTAGFRTLSNVVKVSPAAQAFSPRSAGGTPPDWVRTPRVLDLLPDVSQLVSKLTTMLDQLGDFTSGYGSMLKSYVKFLDQEIASFEAVAENALALVNRVAALTNTELGGAYMTTFSGQGDSQYLVQDLAQALAPSTDPSRPPFDRGDEFVTGMVLLATAPSAAGLEPVLTMLDLLFGTANAESNVLEQAIAQIDVVLKQAEQATFNASIAVPVSPGPVQVGTDDDGTQDLNCPVVPTVTPSFKDDFTL